MNIIRLDKIRYERQGTTILHDINWQIRRGEHWGMLGRNGAGKTTLLKVLTGYQWPTAGEVRVLGQRYGQCDLRELRKRIGWVSSSIEHQLPPTNTALQVTVSGLDASIGLYRKMEDTEWSDARGALGQVGLEELADRPFGLLSQGEQQRVLIARALINRPALLILDEPCAGLDPMAREELLVHLERLATAPHAPTLIFVTHHIEEFGRWITHVLLLAEGRLVAARQKTEALTSEILSRTFGGPCEVRPTDGRYHLRVLTHNADAGKDSENASCYK